MNKFKRKNLQNNNWKFMYGDIESGSKVNFDDSKWYDIGLPHSFGIPYFMENEFYVGYGCYRKILEISSDYIGKKIMLEFQGVFQEAEIFINGAIVGSHQGGYTAFIIDITDVVITGKNLLFVRVNNKWNPRLAPRAGEHVFNGGIYRDVSLIVTEKIFFTWYGTYIKTSNVSSQKAEVFIQTEVANETNANVCCKLVSSICYNGKKINIQIFEKLVNIGEVTYFDQTTLIENPKLWSPEYPNLYMLKSELYINDILIDEDETTFGIRWFEFTSEHGFFLNGKHYNIIGANVHQDHAGWSDAVTHSGIRRDIKLIKDCGMNFIRGSHYPHHTVFADECDKQGILFWSELCYWGTGGPCQEGYWYSSAYPVNESDQIPFEESCISTLKEMIRTNRNHPSIIVWSMCNEPFFSAPVVMEKAKKLASRLAQLSKKLDDSRPAAIGGAQREGFDVLGDIAGYNGDGASLYINPPFPNFVSEYGSAINCRPGVYEPCYTDNTNEDFSWRSGKAIWCGFHHGSIYSNMGYMGMIDYYRLPLNTWYWYRHMLLGIEPLKPPSKLKPYKLLLNADNLIIKSDGTEDAHVVVSAVDINGNRADCDIEIILEIVSGGAILPTGNKMFFSKDRNNFLDGIGAIELRSYFAGKNIIKASSDELIQAEIIITSVGGEEWKNHKLNYLLAAPTVMIPHKSYESVNIARNRPVFCSSFQNEFKPSYVVDCNENTKWFAESSKSGEWIMVDLEGNKKVSRAEIILDNSITEFDLLISDSAEDFKKIDTVKSGATATVSFDDKKFRYMKLIFTNSPTAIFEIRIYD